MLVDIKMGLKSNHADLGVDPCKILVREASSMAALLNIPPVILS